MTLELITPDFTLKFSVIGPLVGFALTWFFTRLRRRKKLRKRPPWKHD